MSRISALPRQKLIWRHLSSEFCDCDKLGSSSLQNVLDFDREGKMNFEKTRVILASSSPRRKEYLSLICPKFEIIKPLTDETSIYTTPKEFVIDVAHQKGLWVTLQIQNDQENCIVISADTIVSKNGEIFGKPNNNDHALEMLNRLANGTHEVMTAVSLFYRKSGIISWKTIQLCVQATVTIPGNCEDLIREYASTNDPLDKAGAYGIQGFPQTFISHINGSFSAIVGFPIHEVSRELRKIVAE